MNDNINVTPSFVLAGEATFTVSNGDGRHYTYHIYKSKPTSGFLFPRWFIKLLTGPDHTDVGKGYSYMGMLWWPRESGWDKAESNNIHRIPTVKLTARSRRLTDDTSLKVARWALRAIWQAANKGYAVPARMSIQHVGRCGRCGAVLTNPASLDTGLGPECAEKAGVEWSEKNRTQRHLPMEHSMAEGVTDEEWSKMTEAERWSAIGERPSRHTGLGLLDPEIEGLGEGHPGHPSNHG